MKMKAFVISEPNKHGLAEVDVPVIGPNEVLMKTLASGICHSDYDLMAGKYILPLHFPIIPGHEFCGEVVEIGANVKNLKVGDRVVGECNIGCGTCPVCQEIAGFCPDANHFGFTQDGADAEYFKADAGWLHKIPDTMDDLTGAMVETFSISYKGIREAGGVDASDVCVIYGGGSIGACAAAVSHAMGAYTIVIEPVEFKREICKKMGADATIDPINQNTIEEILKLTDGFGADLVVECSGRPACQKETFEAVKNGGRVCFIGISFDEISVPLGKFQQKGIRAFGSNGSPNVWDRCIKFIDQAKLDLSPINTHTFKFVEIEKAFEFTKDPKNNAVKVILTF